MNVGNKRIALVRALEAEEESLHREKVILESKLATLESKLAILNMKLLSAKVFVSSE